MMKTLIHLLLLVPIFFISCDSVRESQGQTISGTVTVSDITEWSNLKIGLFDGNNTGGDLYHNGSAFFASPVFVYDAILCTDISTSPEISLTPLSFTDLTGKPGSNATWELDLPETPVVSSVGSGKYYYQLIIWQDINDNDNLDMFDGESSVSIYRAPRKTQQEFTFPNFLDIIDSHEGHTQTKRFV
jgi:hypothetical protein